MLHAFEIDNFKVSRKLAAKIAEGIPNSKIIKHPKRFLSWFREEVFCKFEINGIRFQIDEPYGDNSRYWIGKLEEGGFCKELLEVEKAFKNAW